MNKNLIKGILNGQVGNTQQSPKGNRNFNIVN